MPSHFAKLEIAVAVVVLFFLVVLAMRVYLKYKKSKTQALRNRFGSDYQRAVVEQGTSQKG
jgi:hypothetical protein